MIKILALLFLGASAQAAPLIGSQDINTKSLPITGNSTTLTVTGSSGLVVNSSATFGYPGDFGLALSSFTVKINSRVQNVGDVNSSSVTIIFGSSNEGSSFGSAPIMVFGEGQQSGQSWFSLERLGQATIVGSPSQSANAFNNSSPQFQVRSIGGSLSSITGTPAGNILGRFVGAGSIPGATIGTRISMNMVASENWTSSGQGTYFSWFTQKTGTINAANRHTKMSLSDNGDLGIYDQAGVFPLDMDAKLDVRGIGSSNAFSVRSDGNNVDFNVDTGGQTHVAKDLEVVGEVISGYEMVNNSCALTTTCIATCAGSPTTIIGGGCDTVGTLRSSFPDTSTSWTCNTVVNTGITAYAICARLAP